MASLIDYRYVAAPTLVPGTPILVDSTNMVTVDQTTAGVVFGGFPGSDLTSAPYKYEPRYPLMLKVFCQDVVFDRTGEFEVKVTGPAGSGLTCNRRNENSFALMLNVRDWDMASSMDTTVSVLPRSPMVAVKMNCICGLATDAADRSVDDAVA